MRTHHRGDTTLADPLILPRLLAVEVKATTHPTYKDPRHLRTFMGEYGDDVVGGILVHAGEETAWVSEGVLGVPWRGVV
jgi:hypothetical protein